MNIREYSSFLFSSFGNFEVKASNRARITRQLEDERRSKFKVAREIAFFLTRCRIKRLRFGELVARLFKLSPPSFRTSRRGEQKVKLERWNFLALQLSISYIYIPPSYHTFETKIFPHVFIKLCKVTVGVDSSSTNEQTRERTSDLRLEALRLKSHGIYIYIYI